MTTSACEDLENTEEDLEQLDDQTNTNGHQFSDEILQQLELLHNSVKQVNEIFSDNEEEEQNSGIFYAHLVYVN